MQDSAQERNFKENCKSLYSISPFSASCLWQAFISALTAASDDSASSRHLCHFVYLHSTTSHPAVVAAKNSKDQRKCPHLLTTLTAKPTWPLSTFSWAPSLQNVLPEIKKELLALRSSSTMGFQPYRAPSAAGKINDDFGSLSHTGGDWNVFYLKLHNISFSENAARCPVTMEWMNSIPGTYDHAFFSVLAPGTHVTPHHGPTNRKVRLQIPLIVPKTGECALRVADEIIVLEEGKPFVFDDSFEHEAWNHDTNDCRFVLIVDFWHPDLSPREIKFFSYLRDAQLRQSKRAVALDNADSQDNFFNVIEKAYRSNSTNPDAVWKDQTTISSSDAAADSNEAPHVP